MESLGAIVFLTREDNSPSPLLGPILFDPAARWLSAFLERAGAADFLVVCHPDDLNAARDCFPEGTDFISTDAPESAVAAFTARHSRVVQITWR